MYLINFDFHCNNSEPNSCLLKEYKNDPFEDTGIQWKMNTFNSCSNDCRTWTPHTGYKYCPQSCGNDGFCAGPLDNFNYPEGVRTMYLINSAKLDPTKDITRCIKPGKLD